MLRFIICDDDRKFCEKEKSFIEKYYNRTGLSVKIDIFHSAERVVALGEKVTLYDAVFLDISVDRVNGLDVAEYLNEVAPDLIIVFVSGSLSFAPDGYKVGAMRYILKDKDMFYSSMEECLLHILNKARNGDMKYVQMKDSVVRFSTDRVLYVESKSHKITYYLYDLYGSERSHSVYGKLDDAEAALSGRGFLRAHQSYLVNMNYVLDVKRYAVTFSDGKSVPVSKSRYKDVVEAFKEIIGSK